MDPISLIAMVAEWTPVVSLVKEALVDAGGPAPQGGPKLAYDIIAFAKGMEVVGRAGAWLADRTTVQWDDRAVALFQRGVGWLLKAARNITTPGKQR